MNKNKLKVVSLFSGYGTQELALKYIGVDYENVANCDNFKHHATATLKATPGQLHRELLPVY